MKHYVFKRIISLLVVFSLVFQIPLVSFALTQEQTEASTIVEKEIAEEEFVEEELSASERIVEIAKSQIGFYESGINKYTDWYYGRTTESSWCCIFVSWCAAQAGALDSAVPQRSSCDSMRNWFKLRNRYYSIYDGYVPVKGDIVFYNTEVDNTDNIHHVEIITEDGYQLVNDTVGVKSIGGNTSNLSFHGSQYVMEKFRPIDGSRAQIVGFCHPSYEISDSIIGKMYTFSDEMRTGDMRYIHSKYISLIYRIEEFWVNLFSGTYAVNLF